MKNKLFFIIIIGLIIVIVNLALNDRLSIRNREFNIYDNETNVEEAYQFNSDKDYENEVLSEISISELSNDGGLEDSEKPNYTIIQIADEYQLDLYNNYGECILSENYPKEPEVSELTKDILKIFICVGSPASYVYFFNQETSTVSEVYFNPIIWGNNYIAYMEDNALVLTDIFGAGELYYEISRDFTRTANPISAIIDIEMYDGNSIVLTYYSGDDYVEQSELIEIFS